LNEPSLNPPCKFEAVDPLLWIERSRQTNRMLREPPLRGRFATNLTAAVASLLGRARWKLAVARARNRSWMTHAEAGQEIEGARPELV
jgi:hypothetical protein